MAVAYAQSACPASAHAQLCAKPRLRRAALAYQRWSTVWLRCDTCANRLGRLRRLRRLHEFKFVVVYMHSQEHEDTDRFCRCAALHTRHSAVLLCFRTPYRVRRSACEPKETKHTVPPLIPFSFVCACGVSQRSDGLRCSEVLCTSDFADFINDNYIFWAGSPSGTDGLSVNNALNVCTYALPYGLAIEAAALSLCTSLARL